MELQTQLSEESTVEGKTEDTNAPPPMRNIPPVPRDENGNIRLPPPYKPPKVKLAGRLKQSSLDIHSALKSRLSR